MNEKDRIAALETAVSQLSQNLVYAIRLIPEHDGLRDSDKTMIEKVVQELHELSDSFQERE